MATAHEVGGRERPPTTGTTPDDRPLTLADEHGLLLRPVAVRAEELLTVTADGGWPARELDALLTYMRVEVLRQATDEERLPAGQVVDVVVDRLLRVRSGDRVDLHSSSDPYAVWQRMNCVSPGDYGFDYPPDGPDRWRVQVTRRLATA